MCLSVAAALSLLPQPLARLVKCMAATTAVYALQSEEVMEHEEVPDVYSDSGEVISDGCCYASYKSLQLLHDAMQLQQQGGRERPTLAGLLESEPSGHLPSSAVQVRLGGIKGMYSLKMGIEGRRLFWRKSMKKFDAESAQLEVCEWARWLPVIHDWRSKDEPLTSSALPPPLSLLLSAPHIYLSPSSPALSPRCSRATSTVTSSCCSSNVACPTNPLPPCRRGTSPSFQSVSPMGGRPFNSSRASAQRAAATRMRAMRSSRAPLMVRSVRRLACSGTAFR